MKKYSAFSLTELAITITILGILIVGIGQGSRIITKTQLTSARNQTKTNSVSVTKNLVAWYETTSEASLKKIQSYNNNAIDTWHDINPQASVKNDLIRDYDTHVQYRTNAINGLPALYFDGDITDQTTFFFASALPSASSAFTFFIVSKMVSDADSNYRVLLRNGDVGTGWLYQANIGLYRQVTFYSSATTLNEGNGLTSAPEIVSGLYDGTNFTLYVNGTVKNTDAIAAPNTPTNVLYVGANSPTDVPWLGYVGEIIVFDRDLETEEQIEIERYLGRKWKIRTNR